MEDGIIISDDFIEKVSDYFLKQGACLEDVLDRYIYIMQHTYKYAIPSGSVHNGLAEYVGIAETLNGELRIISEQIPFVLSNFLQDVNEQDK